MTRSSCYFCNENNDNMLEEHHVVPRRFGGSDADENLVTVCASCHNGLESLYDSRFYDKLDVEKQSSTEEGLKSFDEKHPFIWAVRSYCMDKANGYTKTADSSDRYKVVCDVGYFRKGWQKHVSGLSDKKIVERLQSDEANRCGLWRFSRREKASVEADRVIFELRYSASRDNFIDGNAVRDYDDNELAYSTWGNA